MSDIDRVAFLGHELLRSRVAELIAETSAWSVGLSDRPHVERRNGRLRPTGATLGARAAVELPLGGEEDAVVSLGEAVPGTFRDALNALTPTGAVYAEDLEREVLEPFAVRTCIEVLQLARTGDPETWAELLDVVGEDGDADLADVVRAGEWAGPLTDEAEELVLSAIGEALLVDVEAEGLTRAVVDAAERETRAAIAPVVTDEPPDEAALAGALFLAETAMRTSGLRLPVAPDDAEPLVRLLQGEGLEPEEIVGVLPELPVEQDTIESAETVLEADAIVRGDR